MQSMISPRCGWMQAANNLRSKGYFGKSSKQCRDRSEYKAKLSRWLHYLRPENKYERFSPAEEETILTSHLSQNNKWVEIAKNLPGRY